MKNLGVLFNDTVGKFPGKPALYFKESGRYQSLSWSGLSDRVRGLASFFLTQGIQAGDKITILSENCPEWAVVDLAAQSIGAVTVPIYPSLTSPEILYILNDSETVLVAVSGKTLFEKLFPIQDRMSKVRWVLAFDSALAAHQSELRIPLTLMREAEKTPVNPTLDLRTDGIAPGAIASIIYTSGTTGNPKGVMLTHANFIHNVILSRTALRMSEKDKHLSFLPLSHVFERMAGYYLMIHIGAAIAYAENMDTVPGNILEMKPTFLLGVPRFYEKIKESVEAAVKAGGFFKKALFFWALEIRRKKRGNRLEGALADRLVYRKFRKRLGGRVRFCISGGAPLPKEIAEFFRDLGVMIYEGYGLTETSPVISVNREGKVKFGTVGIPLEDVKVRIAEDGEILTQSACVMKGYFNKPEETRAVLKEGWFYTGDLGKIDKEGFLSITGRKKELIVTSGGKKVCPQVIEEMLEKDPFVLRCTLYGEGKNYLTALIVPREDRLKDYARQQKIAYASYAGLVRDVKIHQFMEGRLEALSRDLANYEKIKSFVLLDHDFTQASGELTATLKVKREVVFARHHQELSRLYETGKA